ncbi:MAG TPA: phosphoenolpyruvate carboxykinase (ATP), partial [Thermoanaerobaculia bacterium]|nr:phosphoenolpyruvate carboxykinase (ATP) [Thermoanaerobaculia bacterium]
MENCGPHISRFGLEHHGIRHARRVYWNLPVARLYEEALARGEASMVAGGPLVVRTGQHTGRSPNDKFFVREPSSEGDLWWGKVNRAIAQDRFNSLFDQVRAYLQGRDLFVFDGYAGADPRYRMPVRVVSELAWHSHFSRNMFIEESDPEKLASFEPGFTVIGAPHFRADPEKDGTNSPTFILVDLGQRTVLIGGSLYSGEIKKSIFSAMNYYLPAQGVLPMHCSANYGRDRDDVALFFGLSGTGKTTLSADPERTLVGDDEHGWSDQGVFNIEGGCYAKVIRLSAEGEPDIYATTRRYETILENVVFDDAT